MILIIIETDSQIEMFKSKTKMDDCVFVKPAQLSKWLVDNFDKEWGWWKVYFKVFVCNTGSELTKESLNLRRHFSKIGITVRFVIFEKDANGIIN